MLVEKEKNNLVISFVFNPYLVTIVGSFDGRKFDNKKKRWTVPLVHTVHVVDTLGKSGFRFTDEVIEVYKEKVHLTQKIHRLKEGIFKTIEKKMLDELSMPFYMYQRIGAGFLTASSSSLLGDQPGLGKTMQSIGSTLLKNSKKTLIFCPVSVKKTWQEELEKWAPDKTSVIVGGTPKQRQEQWNTDVQYYICNYHLLQRDIKFMKLINWDFIIADEATSISNPKALTSKNLKKLKTKNKIALTGTPLSNSVEDVWSIIEWIQPGLLGTYWQFIDEYCMKDKYNAITGYKNLTKLKQKIEPFMLRRLKKDVLTELPDKTYENIYVEFTPEEQALYEAIKEETMDKLKAEGMFDKNNLSSALVKIVRLKQMADSCELINGSQTSSKLDALKELLQVVLSGDEKAIVFTTFREMAVILMRELEQYHPLLIAGGVSPEERDANRLTFNTDEEHKLLIMTSAGSMGLNLQRASNVIHYDLPWSIASTEQREDRAHRHGQKRNVTIYRMLVQNSIDEYILQVLHGKKDVADIVLGDRDQDEAEKVKITREDIENILS
jgi:SNF2 family DNA or RNA helicase